MRLAPWRLTLEIATARNNLTEAVAVKGKSYVGAPGALSGLLINSIDDIVQILILRNQLLVPSV
jgi:hypothetical protein